MRLSVIIPVYNEQATVARLINRVRAVQMDKEIIVVDDGSTDGTRELLERLRDQVDTLVFHDRNRGKGAAVRTGIRHVTGDVVVIQDADLEYDPRDFRRLIQPIEDGRADVVYGSRFAPGSPCGGSMSGHRLGNRLLTLLSNTFTHLRLSDMETCYKMFRAEAIQRVSTEQDRFGFEPEITAKISRMGYRIHEMGISYRARDVSHGKKIGWRDGVQAIWCIAKYGLQGRASAH